MILLNCIFKVQTINKLNPFEKKNKNYLDLENTEQMMIQDSNLGLRSGSFCFMLSRP